MCVMSWYVESSVKVILRLTCPLAPPLGQQVSEVEVKDEPLEQEPKPVTPSPTRSTAAGSPTQFETRHGQLTPTEGSVRSDEGYDSNGYHHDFNTVEDSSDSEGDNNYVLDFR